MVNPSIHFLPSYQAPDRINFIIISVFSSFSTLMSRIYLGELGRNPCRVSVPVRPPASSSSSSLLKRSFHPRRKQYVSSGALRPSWEPFASRTSAEQQLRFSLRLVTGGGDTLVKRKFKKTNNNFDLRQTVWLISPSNGFNCRHSRRLAEFAAAV